VIPGLLLAALYAVYIAVFALLRPDLAPKPERDPAQRLDAHMVADLLRALVPPILLMAAVLGSIFFGIASPTEASGIGALGATILAAFDRKLTWKVIREVCEATAKTSAFLYALIFAAGCFSVVLRGYGGDNVIEAALTAIPLPPEGILITLLLVIFLLGFVLDWMEIILVVAPLTVPIVVSMGFDPIWVAMLIAICLQTSFITPPVGMALFYVKNTAPAGTTTGQIYRGIIPFVILQLLGLAVVWIFPQLALWLPKVAY